MGLPSEPAAVIPEGVLADTLPPTHPPTAQMCARTRGRQAEAERAEAAGVVMAPGVVLELEESEESGESEEETVDLEESEEETVELPLYEAAAEEAAAEQEEPEEEQDEPVEQEEPEERRRSSEEAAVESVSRSRSRSRRRRELQREVAAEAWRRWHEYARMSREDARLQQWALRAAARSRARGSDSD